MTVPTSHSSQRLTALEDRLFNASRLRLYPPTIVALYTIALVVAGVRGQWLFDAHGHLRLMDFAWLWTGGRIALAGEAIRAFDYNFFSAAQAAIPINLEPGSEYFHWIYPPVLFFYAIPFALLPYLAGFVAWAGAMLAFYLATIHAILPRRSSLAIALMPFPVVANLYFGHTGFLVAGLLGVSLVLIDKAPFAAGLVLGLLTFKPQLGLLFPIVLLVSGQWRMILGAAVSTVLLSAAAAWAFGIASWIAFAASLHNVNPQTLMPDDHLVAILQTVFGLARWAGFGLGFAWNLHLIVAAGTIVLTCLIWRSRAAPALKAAALATGALIVTPYLMIYDLVAIGVPAAFLIRHALANGFLPGERLAMLGGMIALAVFYWMPIGPFVLLVLLFLIARRVSGGGSVLAFEHRDQPERHPAA